MPGGSIAGLYGVGIAARGLSGARAATHGNRRESRHEPLQHAAASQHTSSSSYGCSSGSALSGGGAGNACRNAYTSATSLSDITFAL